MNRKILFYSLILLPRLPFLFFTRPGHYDSDAELEAINTWVSAGHYIPIRHPGSPLYELVGSLLAKLSVLFGFDTSLFPCILSFVLFSFVLGMGFHLLKKYF